MIETQERPIEATEERTNILRIEDRCDSCGAQAYVGVLFGEDKLDLLFCAHHFKRFEDKITATASKVFDERWKLSDQRQGV